MACGGTDKGDDDDDIPYSVEGTDHNQYIDDEWATDGWTPATCTEHCLASNACTGFEHPPDGECCWLYFDSACDMSGLPDFEPAGCASGAAHDTHTLIRSGWGDVDTGGEWGEKSHDDTSDAGAGDSAGLTALGDRQPSPPVGFFGGENTATLRPNREP